MMPVMQIDFLLYKMEAGKTEWGVSGRGRDRDREEQINGVRDRA
jgi:hypothetical protein